MQLWVDALNILQGNGLIEEHAVERHGETSVNVVAMEYCYSYHSAHKVEVRQMLLKVRTQVN